MKNVFLLLFFYLSGIANINAAVFIQCPPPQDLGCNPRNIPRPRPNQVGATSDCQPVKVVHVQDLVTENGCERIMKRVYEAIDACGNKAQCVQLFNWIEDKEPPVFVNCDGEFQLNCNAEKNNEVPPANPVLINVTDNCGKPTVILISENRQEKNCSVKLTRRYRATDACGNSSTCKVTYNWSVDREAPVIVKCAPNLSLGCNPSPDELTPENGMDKIKAKDNCGKVSIEIGLTQEINQGCFHQLIHTYIIKDDCGNQTTCTRVISYRKDDEKPVIISCAPDLDLGCTNIAGFQIPGPNVSQVNATDNCGIVNIQVKKGDIVKDGCKASIDYTYTVTDICGNSASCIQHIKWIDDKIPPTIACFDVDLGCNPTSIPSPSPAQILATDNCCLESVKHFADSDIIAIGCKRSMVRYYVATDCCGNTSKCEQAITWKVDLIPPVIISCPSDLDLGCNPVIGDLAGNGINEIKAEDNCGEVFISFGGIETIQEGCDFTNIYTYIVKDECGNSSTCTRKVTFTKDNTPPVIIQCPEDLVMGCPGPNGIVIPEPDLDKLIFEDDCGATVEVLDGNGEIVIFGCKATFVRGYLVTDKCGNTAICQQNIVWTWDKTPPTMVCLDLDLGCNPDKIPDADPAKVIVTDNCCIESVKHFADSDITVVGCEYSMIRYYEATDCCGNTSRCEQSIKWKVDSEAPIVKNCDEVIDLGCQPIPETALIARCLGEIEATDQCGEVKITFAGSETRVEGCATYLTLKFVITDECGNSTTCTKIFKWVNNETPVITKCPEDRYLGCFKLGNLEIPDPNPEDIEVASDCPYQVTVLNGIDVVVFGCKATYVRAYVVTNACGKSDTCTQTFTWTSDNVPPQMVCLDLDLGCNPESIPEPEPAKVIVTDNCCIESVKHIADSDIVVFGCEYSMIRYYEATDCCGNTSRCEQSIKWTVDKEAPIVKNCDEVIDLGCEQLPETVLIGRIMSSLDVSDNCGVPTITYAGSDTIIEGCTKYITFKFVIADACGNATTCGKIVKMVNNVKPVIVKCPGDKFLGCFRTGNFNVPPPNPEDLIVKGDCPYTVEILNGIDVVVFGCTATYTRAYVVKNACGNADTCSQTFTWTVDNIDPIIKKCIDERQYGCVKERPFIPEFNKDQIIVEDNCGIAIIDHIDQELVDGCFYTLRRWVIVEDNCDNIAYCYGDFTWTLIEGDIVDIPFPADQTIFCGQVPSVPDFTSTNACGVLYPIFVGEVTFGGCDDGGCTVFRTWKKIDCFGNETFHVQVIKLSCDITIGSANQSEDRTGLSERSQPEIKVYPNPGADYFNIDWTSEENKTYNLSILDINGRLMYQQKVNGVKGLKTEQIDASKFENGIYLIQLISEDQRQIIKWIKTQ